MENSRVSEPLFLRIILITIALTFLTLFLFLPLITIFIESLSKGVKVYFDAITDSDTLASIKLTLEITLITVVCNLIFGIAAAWSMSKFRFSGKSLITTLIDIPFSISPVIVGLAYIIFLGTHSALGSWLAKFNIQVIFAFPGMVLATIFVTLPFIARELTTIMEQQGSEDEEAAILLGARGWQVFLFITLPKVKWGLLYGALLCTARAIGESGAVSVVSGHIRGITNTMPLHVEDLYNEYNFAAAFAIASLLTIAALLTIFLKSFMEWRYKE